MIDLGVDIKLASFRHAYSLTEALEAAYQANRLAVVRQLDVGKWKKNPQTERRPAMPSGSTGRSGIRRTRSCVRCVVHFAVDPGEVMMTHQPRPEHFSNLKHRNLRTP